MQDQGVDSYYSKTKKNGFLRNKVFTSTLKKFSHTGLRKIVIAQYHQSKLHSNWKTLNQVVRKTESIQWKHRSVGATQQGGNDVVQHECLRPTNRSQTQRSRGHTLYITFLKPQLLESESEVKVAQSCLTLFDAMDYTVHGTLQASILDWVAFPFSRDRTQVSHIAGGFFTSWATRESQEYWSG